MAFDDYNKGHMGRGGSQWGNNDWEAGDRRRQEEDRIREAERYNREQAERQRQEREAQARRHQEAMRAHDAQLNEQRQRYQRDADDAAQRARRAQQPAYSSAPTSFTPSAGAPRGQSSSYTTGGSSGSGRSWFGSLVRFVGWTALAGVGLLVFAVLSSSGHKTDGSTGTGSTDRSAAVEGVPGRERARRSHLLRPPVGAPAPAAVIDDPAPAAVIDDPAPAAVIDDPVRAPVGDPAPVAADEPAPGRVPYLGVVYAELAPEEVAASGLEKGVGSIVRELVPDGPAAAVLKVGDIILTVDRLPIRGRDDVQSAVRAHVGSEPIPLTIVRDGKFPQVVHITPRLVVPSP